MTRRRHIGAVGQESAEDIADQEPLGDDAPDDASSDDVTPSEDHEVFEELTTNSSKNWIIPTVFGLAIAGWTGYFAWVNHGAMLSGAGAQQWIDWVVEWSVPTLLVIGVWLLALRNSVREAARFGNTAALLSAESERLEERLTVINRELSLAREFLGSQTRDLEYLGRNATERIGENADRLEQLIVDNAERVDTIARVSNTALENMERLRDNLPVIANSARDVTNQIGGAGQTAAEQLDELVAGFKRLNEFGSASERQVRTIRSKLDAALAAFGEQIEAHERAAAERFEALADHSDKFRSDLDRREVDALAALRTRAETLRDELATTHDDLATQNAQALDAVAERMDGLRVQAEQTSAQIRAGEETAIDAWRGHVEALETRLHEALEKIEAVDAQAAEKARVRLAEITAEVERIDAMVDERHERFGADFAMRQERIESDQETAIAGLSALFENLDSDLSTRREEQLNHYEALAQRSNALGEQVADLGSQVERAAEIGTQAGNQLSDTSQRLERALTDSRDNMADAGTALSDLTDGAVRLLELIRASAKHGKEELPLALSDYDHRLQDVESRAIALRAMLGETAETGEALSGRLEQAREESERAAANFDALTQRVAGSTAEQAEAIDGLRSAMAALEAESTRAAQQANGALKEAIEALETEARKALNALEEDQAARVRAIAESIGEASASAIGNAVEERTGESLGQLEAATTKATEASRASARQLTEQLAKVNELTGNLEARVTRAREKAEEQINHDFSRRVALITESLNSNAIDIGKALSTEVTDTAWARYLRGDRGIFTRRAVSLLNNTEAREIAEIYDDDPDFRENVSRYIHDFEAMLRTLLSTRDGNAISVTLLSSDMGKLYVALAQSIERLRS